MGMPNDMSLSIMLAAENCAWGKSTALLEHDQGLDILVPCLLGNLFLKSGKCLVHLFLVHKWLWVQGVNEANLLKLSPCKAFTPPVLSCY